MDLQLKGRTALVTGASVGIGRGIAHALAAEGVRLALTARRMDKLQEVAAEIAAAGGAEPVIFEQDMLAEDAAPRIAQRALAGLGGVDILVNNAGGSRSFKDLHVSEEAWNEAITLNFHRPRQLGDALIDQMIERLATDSANQELRRDMGQMMMDYLDPAGGVGYIQIASRSNPFDIQSQELLVSYYEKEGDLQVAQNHRRMIRQIEQQVLNPMEMSEPPPVATPQPPAALPQP
jgi:NAD(P)-dependent dehydrogenase (short-subunit alcohol dehydrogenase family)